jgi:osmoprotectant transport system ATP-binding protein
MSENPAVELHQVTKLFPGGVRAVDNISLAVPGGKVVALLGTSGCGKTTTLRLINRLEEATAGEIRVRGQDVRTLRPELLRRSIGYVIQEGGLFPHRNVTDNVATVPRLLGWPRQQIRSRVGAVLDMVGLPEGKFGRRMPAELSGGQRQRVGVARGLAADPDLLLMDEPFGALDPGTREAVQDEFLRLNYRLKKTVVLVTHDIAEAGKLAEDIVLMDRGQIIQEGPLRDLLLRPANDRVRAFLGRQGQGLALETLRLKDILPDLRPVPVSSRPIRVAREMRLSQVLVAVTEAEPAATVLVEEDPGRAYSAGDVRRHILAELQQGNGSEEGKGS